MEQMIQLTPADSSRKKRTYNVRYIVWFEDVDEGCIMCLSDGDTSSVDLFDETAAKVRRKIANSGKSVPR